MHRRAIVIWAAIAAAAMAAEKAAPKPAAFSGVRALEFTQRVVGFGPRPVNSAAIVKLRTYLRTELAAMRGAQLIPDKFMAATPMGPLPMENVVAKFPGTSGKAVAITGHYDTKLMTGERFLGANDGGASTGLLLELARVLSRRPHKDDIYLVWFDGEEALVRWSSTDGLYGSRHLAARWQKDGTLARIKALVNIDMIGDRDLGILPEGNSSPGLRELIWRAAADLGYSKHFLREPGWIEDDHVPFLKLGVNACDLIDFDYGPGNEFWHQPADTMDKLAASSFQVVGDVLLEVIRRLE